MKAGLFDRSIVGTAQEVLDLIANILESSTAYSVIGKDLDGKIPRWNEGARRMYGYEPEEVVGKLNSDVLHTPEDVAAGKPKEIIQAALQTGKWEMVISRIRKDGRRITARVVIMPRRNAKGDPIGFLLISKDISYELQFAGEIQKRKLFGIHYPNKLLPAGPCSFVTSRMTRKSGVATFSTSTLPRGKPPHRCSQL